MNLYKNTCRVPKYASKYKIHITYQIYVEVQNVCCITKQMYKYQVYVEKPSTGTCKIFQYIKRSPVWFFCTNECKNTKYMYTKKYQVHVEVSRIISCRFLNFRKYLIVRFNRFASNRRNIKSSMPNFII